MSKIESKAFLYNHLNNYKLRVFIIFWLSLFYYQATAQIFINEACADNENIVVDEEGDYVDWLELYNSGSTAINLQGYTLSDDITIPDQWTFPNIEIPANGFLLIFASGKDFNGQDPHTNFKISKDGETLILSTPQMEVVDQLNVLPLDEDQSYGRQPDGSDVLHHFYTPSPAESNNDSPFFDFANKPKVLNTNFFNSETIFLELECDQPGCQIYYTVDGNVPDENAVLYNGPVALDTTTTIRAVSLSPTLLLSEPTTRTFFINEKHSLPIITITTAPEHLWDWENGIFVAGPNADNLFPFFGANFWSDTEIPIHFEFFENDALSIEYPLGARIHGGKGARTKPMKPLRLLAKGSFGTPLIDYPFFKNKSVTKFERLVIRNASGDFNTCHMRDEFLARYFISEELYLDAVAERPVVIYINGVYWGVMHLREKIDKHYVRFNHDADPENVDILEEDSLVVEGNFDIFEMHESFVLNNDLRETSNFDIAAGYFDLDNLSDYVICQTYVNNTDWPSNNLKYWRERKEGAKWRYLLFDMDLALGLAPWSVASANSFAVKMARDDVRMIAILKAFLKNDNYRYYFINRYADLMNATFRPDNFNAEIYRSWDELDEEMKRHLPRWGAVYDNWNEVEMPKLIDFATERPAYSRQFIMEYFELNSEDLISLNTYPKNAGNIQINSLALTKDQLPWSGYYFNEVPIQLTVVPEAGYTFSHWESTYSGTSIATTTSITVHPRDAETLTAVFVHDPEDPALQIVPNPANAAISLNLTVPTIDQLKINVYNTAGQQMIGTISTIATTGNNQITLDIGTLDGGLFIVEIVGANFSISERFVKLGTSQ